jgi:hypothetical protein
VGPDQGHIDVKGTNLDQVWQILWGGLELTFTPSVTDNKSLTIDDANWAPKITHNTSGTSITVPLQFHLLDNTFLLVNVTVTAPPAH